MNIGILGGSFDPPHRSHEVLANKCIEHKLVDEVWVCPTYNHVDKKNFATFEQRVQMCKLAFTGWFKKVKVCQMEKDNLSGTTFYLIERLRETYPQHTFKLIIGEDRADCIEEWYLWRELIEDVPFIVFKREDYVSFAPIDVWYKYNDRHTLLNCEDCWMSSTYVRRLIGQKCYKLASQIVSRPKVVKYIKENKLYSKEIIG